MLRWTCLVLALTQAFAWGSAFVPGDLEIDFIFPRENQTYAPSEYTPFVFAIQNPALAAQFELASSVEIWKGDRRTHAFGATNRTWGEHTDEDVLIFYWGTTSMNSEDNWFVSWRVTWGSWAPFSTNKSMTQYFTFSTKNGTQAMDLVEATSEKTCNDTRNFTMSVKDIGRRKDDGIFAVPSLPSPRPDPCKAKIDEKQASKIVSNIKKDHDGVAASGATLHSPMPISAVLATMGLLLYAIS